MYIRLENSRNFANFLLFGIIQLTTRFILPSYSGKHKQQHMLLLALIVYFTLIYNTLNCLRQIYFLYICIYIYIYIYIYYKIKVPEGLNIPPSIDNPLPLYMAIPSLYIFSNPQLFTGFFRQYCLNEIRDKHKNKPMRETCFSCLEGFKSMLHAFFISNTFIYMNRLKLDLK